MSRTRVISAAEAVYISSNTATGFSFINQSGVLNNNLNDLLNNYNLLLELYRVTEISYGISAQRTNIKSLGKSNYVSQPIINNPTANLSVSYNLMGVLNEARIGLNVNYPRFEFPFSGLPYFTGNVCPISGLVSRDFNRDTGTFLNWPMNCRDKKNLYIQIAAEGDDAHYGFLENFIYPDTYQGIDPKSLTRQVLAFGNCYLDSYRLDCVTNSFLKATCGFTCENMALYLSGSGAPIPAIDEVSGLPIPNINFVVPNSYVDGGPSILLPSDVNLTITQITGNNLGTNDAAALTISLLDAKINAYSLGFQFDRQALNGLGYKYPADREINLPVDFSASFSMIVGDGQTGAFTNLFGQDNSYNITVKIKNPFNFIVSTGVNPSQDGITSIKQDVAVRHDMINMLFNSISFKEGIGLNKECNLVFQGTMDPNDLSQGLFISGLLNLAKTEDFLLDSGDNGYLLYDDNTPIVLGYPPLY